MPARVDVKCRRPGPIQPSQIRPLSRPKNAGRYDPHHSDGALVPLGVASATGGSSDASPLRPAPARRPRRGRQAALPGRSVGRPQSGVPQAPTRGAPLLGSRRVGPCQRVYGGLVNHPGGIGGDRVVLRSTKASLNEGRSPSSGDTRTAGEGGRYGWRTVPVRLVGEVSRVHVPRHHGGPDGVLGQDLGGWAHQPAFVGHQHAGACRPLAQHVGPRRPRRRHVGLIAPDRRPEHRATVHRARAPGHRPQAAPRHQAPPRASARTGRTGRTARAARAPRTPPAPRSEGLLPPGPRRRSYTDAAG